MPPFGTGSAASDVCTILSCTANCSAGNCGTSDCSTGNHSTGNSSTSNHSTSNHSTGNYSTGNFSTGNYSTDNFSTGNYSTGNFSTGNCSTSKFSTGYSSTSNFSTSNFSTSNHSTSNYSTSNFSTSNHSTSNFSTGNHSTGNYSTDNFSTGNFSTSNCSTSKFSTGYYSTSNHSTSNFSTSNYSTSNFSTSNFSNFSNYSTDNFSTGYYSTSNFSTSKFSTSNHSTDNFSTSNHSTSNCSTSKFSTGYYSTGNYSTSNYSTSNFSTSYYSTSNHSTDNFSTSNLSTSYLSTGNCSTSKFRTGNYSTSNHITSNFSTGYYSTCDCGTGNCTTSNCSTGKYSTSNCGTENCSANNCNTSNCSTSEYITSNCGTGNYSANYCSTPGNYCTNNNFTSDICGTGNCCSNYCSTPGYYCTNNSFTSDNCGTGNCCSNYCSTPGNYCTNNSFTSDYCGTGNCCSNPSTQSPVSSVVENEVDGTLRTVPKSVTDTATVGSFVSLAAAGMAATSMTTLAMVSMDCRVDGDYELPLVLHPLRFRVEGSHALGCVIGNTALMVGFYWITYLIYRAALAARPLFSESLPLDVRGFVRFPSSALFIVIWLYQGTALGGMLLLLNAPSTWAWFLGCGVSALCILVPIWVFRRVVEGTQYRARFRYDGVIVHRWLVFVIGPGEWVSTSPEKHWVLRYSSMVLTYRQDTAWWALLEFLGAFTLAVITATPTSNHIQCGHAKLASALVFCMLLLLELRYAPHVRQRDNLIDPAMLLCEAVALIFAAITLYENDPNHWTTLTTQILLYTATCFLVIKALLDVFTEICLLRTERRDRLQNDEWGVGPKAAKSDSSDPLAARTPSHASHMEDTMQHVSMKHFQTEDAPFADTGGTLSTVKTSFRIPSSDTMSTSVRNGKPFGLNSLKKEDPCQFSPVERARGTPVSANRSLGSSGAANLYVMTSGISPTSDALNPLASPLSEYTPPVTPNNQSHTSLRSVYPNTSSHDVSVRDALLQASQQPRWQAVRSAARNPAMFPLASGSRTARDVLSSAGSPPASPATRFPGLARANLRQGSTSDAHRMVAVAGTPSPPGHPNQHTSTSTVHFPRRYSMGARSPSTLSSTSDSPRRRHSGVGSSATPGSVQLPPSTAHFPDRRHSITARPPNHFPQLHRVPVATPIDTSL
ncbi:hypothetical protein DIPPA_22667, partial [Diplonema papillatum]